MIIAIGNEDKNVVKERALELFSKCTSTKIDKIDYLESGKPTIANGCISISHTKGATVVAFSYSEIGVDIERKDRKTNIDEISIKDWTIIEAYYKKLGTGISLSKIKKNIPMFDIKTIEYKDFYISISSSDEDVFLTFV